ncbi:MAG: hypothetical protein HFE39_04425 [Clostridiales bacterium]|jgi:hypothetical protein|nr:hypothetical protein [Clostridiales bacterium]
MNKKFKLTLTVMTVLSILLCSCSSQSQQDLGDEYVSGQDMQYMNMELSTLTLNTAESSDGFYFMEENFIFYTDKSSMQTVPLCNKPDCLHNLETDPKKVWKCNAYLPIGLNDTISFWNNHLYVIVALDQSGKEIKNGALMKISLDGTNREYVCNFDLYPTFGVVHRGKFYYIYSNFDESLESDCQIKSIDLTQKNTSEKTLFQGKQKNGSIQRFFCYANYLYFSVSYTKDGQSAWENRRIDIRTNEDIILDSDLIEKNHSMDLGTINNQKLYFYYSKDGLHNDSIWEMGLKGEEKKKFMDMNEKVHIYADMDHLYLFKPWMFVTAPEDRLLQVIDKDSGEKIAEVDLSEIKGEEVQLAAGEGDYLFLSSTVNYEQYFRYAVNKKELLEKGTAKPVEVSSVEMKYTHAQYQ